MQVIFTASPPPPNRSGQNGRSKWRYVTSSGPPHTGNQSTQLTHSTHTTWLALTKGVGPTAENHPQRGLREGLREVAGALRKVHSNRRELCGEILKNKFPSNINCLVFINLFRYSLEHTSYNLIEVSGHNLESSQTWGFCMDFLNHREGGYGFLSGFLPFSFKVYSVQCTVTLLYVQEFGLWSHHHMCVRVL